MIELLTVTTIVAILAGITFVMSEAPREKAREAACMSNLRQIYTGLTLYSNDNQGPEELKGLGDIKLVSDIKGLMTYIPSREVFYCPNSTAAMRKAAWSTYQINFMNPPRDDNTKKYLDWRQTQFDLYGSQAPLVICNIHDETYYAPREQDLDPDLAKPWQIRLQADGAVVSGRYPSKRMETFPLN